MRSMSSVLALVALPIAVTLPMACNQTSTSPKQAENSTATSTVNQANALPTSTPTATSTLHATGSLPPCSTASTGASATSSILGTSTSPYGSTSTSPYGSTGSVGGITTAPTTAPTGGSYGLGLLSSSSPDYTDDIAPMMQQYCTSCHSSTGSFPSIDLTTYANVQSNAQSSLSQIQSGKMPTSGPMPQAEQQIFATWVQNGMLQSASGSSGGSVAGTTTSSTVGTTTLPTGLPTSPTTTTGTTGTLANGQPCSYGSSGYGGTGGAYGTAGAYGTTTSSAISGLPGGVNSTGWTGQQTIGGSGGLPTTLGTATSGEIQSEIQTLLNPPQLAACQAQGHLYDRATGACDQATVATSYPCTDAGVIGEFKQFGVDPTSTIQSWETQGFKVDQCGTFNGDPLVYYVASNGNSGQASVQIKELCRAGSPACN